MLKQYYFGAVPLINFPLKVFCTKSNIVQQFGVKCTLLQEQTEMSFPAFLVLTVKDQFIADLWQKLVGCQNLSILKWVGKEKMKWLRIKEFKEEKSNQISL